MYADGASSFIYHALAHFGYGLPLSRCWLQAYIAVGSYPLPVLYYPHTALVAFRVKIMRQHYIHSLVLQVFLVVEVHLPG